MLAECIEMYTGLWFSFKLHTIVDNHTLVVEPEVIGTTKQEVVNFKPLRSAHRFLHNFS